MHDSLWELVLLSQKGQVLARALRLRFEDEAKDLAARWNLYRSECDAKGYWVVSQIEGRIA